MAWSFGEFLAVIQTAQNWSLFVETGWDPQTERGTESLLLAESFEPGGRLDWTSNPISNGDLRPGVVSSFSVAEELARLTGRQVRLVLEATDWDAQFHTWGIRTFRPSGDRPVRPARFPKTAYQLVSLFPELLPRRAQLERHFRKVFMRGKREFVTLTNARLHGPRSTEVDQELLVFRERVGTAASLLFGSYEWDGSEETTVLKVNGRIQQWYELSPGNRGFYETVVEKAGHDGFLVEGGAVAKWSVRVAPISVDRADRIFGVWLRTLDSTAHLGKPEERLEWALQTGAVPVGSLLHF